MKDTTSEWCESAGCERREVSSYPAGCNEGNALAAPQPLCHALHRPRALLPHLHAAAAHEADTAREADALWKESRELTELRSSTVRVPASEQGLQCEGEFNFEHMHDSEVWRQQISTHAIHAAMCHQSKTPLPYCPTMHRCKCDACAHLKRYKAR